MNDESVRDDYYARLLDILIIDYRTVALIDDIWSGAIQSRKLFYKLTVSQQNTIADLITPAARVWMNGVKGKDWDYRLDEYEIE